MLYSKRSIYYATEFSTREDFSLIWSILPDSGTIIDVPCGAGRLLPLYAGRTDPVILIDIEPQMVYQSNLTIRMLGLPQTVSAISGDIRTFGSPTASAIVIAHGGLQMLGSIDDVQAAIQNCAARSASDALLYIDIVNLAASSRESLPPFLCDADQEPGVQYFQDERCAMTRTWMRENTSSGVRVVFGYEVNDFRTMQSVNYSSESHWLHIDRQLLLDVLGEAGFRVSQVFGNYDRSISTPESPRTIIIAHHAETV